MKHSNLFLITHFSVLFQDESLRLTNSHFVQLFPLCAGTQTLSIFNIYPLRNSRIVRYNSGIGGQSENSHFAQDNSGIVPILTLRRTYTCISSILSFMQSLGAIELTFAPPQINKRYWQLHVLYLEQTRGISPIRKDYTQP